MNDPMYEPQAGDTPYVAELKQRARDLSDMRQKLNPPPQRQTVEERFFSLPQYAAEGPGPVTGGDPVGSYEATGITDATEVAFAQAMHWEPTTMRLLSDTVKAVEASDRPAPNLLSGYTGSASSLNDAVNRRSQHLTAAQQALYRIGGTYAERLGKQLDKLPRAALDMIIRTVDVKRRVAEERPR
jgi:hypothetical protein